MSIKCPKCGSDNTRNSNVNKFLKGVGEASTSMINALVFQKKNLLLPKMRLEDLWVELWAFCGINEFAIHVDIRGGMK